MRQLALRVVLLRRRVWGSREQPPQLGVCEFVLGTDRLYRTHCELFPDPAMRRILAMGWENVSRYGPGQREVTRAIVRVTHFSHEQT
jgi:hypothetical protein